MKKLIVPALAVTALAASSLVVATDALADTAIAGTYNGLGPTRIVDTRAGIGIGKGALGAGRVVTFDALSKVPGHAASSVALTVTAIAPRRGGYLTVGGAGRKSPGTSTLNYRPGENTANAVTSLVDTKGRVEITNHSGGAVNLLVDLSGYWTAGRVAAGTDGAFQPVAPSRIFDSRNGRGRPVPAGGNESVPVAGEGGIPSSGVSAVAVNVTAARPSVSGSFTVLADATDQDGSIQTRSVRFEAHNSEAGMLVVPVNPDGTISIGNNATRPVDVAVDVQGYFTGGSPFEDGSYVSSTPYRAYDSREDTGPLAARRGRNIQLLPAATSLFQAVVVSLTPLGPTRAGHLTAWDGTAPRPNTSTANFGAGQDWTTTAVVPVRSDGTIAIYNGSAAPVDVLVDIQGFVLSDDSTPARASAAKIRSAIARSPRLLGQAGRFVRAARLTVSPISPSARSRRNHV